MKDIFNEITVLLIADSLEQYIWLAGHCIVFGFAFYSLLSVLSYGIIQILHLFNINHMERG